MNDTLKTKSVRLSEEQIAALTESARNDRRDVSEIIRIAIDEFLDRKKAQKSQPELLPA